MSTKLTLSLLRDGWVPQVNQKFFFYLQLNTTNPTRSYYTKLTRSLLWEGCVPHNKSKVFFHLLLNTRTLETKNIFNLWVHYKPLTSLFFFIFLYFFFFFTFLILYILPICSNFSFLLSSYSSSLSLLPLSGIVYFYSQCFCVYLSSRHSGGEGGWWGLVRNRMGIYLQGILVGQGYVAGFNG